MRSTIEGGLWALVLGSCGLGLVSLASEPPVQSAVVDLPQAQVNEQVIAAPVMPAPAPAPVAVQEMQDASEPAVPATQETVTLLLDAPASDTGLVEPVPPASPAAVTDVASPSAEPNDSAVPDAPETERPPVAFASQSPLDVPSQSNLPTIDTTTPAPPAAPARVTAEATAVAPAPAAPQEPVAQTAPEPVSPPAVDAAPAPAAAPVAAETTVDDVVTAEVETETDEPVSGGVRINRPTTETDQSAEEEAIALAPEAPEADLSALAAYAAGFENPDDLSIIAVILVDDGTLVDGAAAIADLGFSPTIVVDALSTDAVTRMDAYRAAGAEVALQVSLPDGAQPVDVEVAFAEAFRIIPQAAMVFSDGSGEIQSSRSVTGQVMDVLRAEGHGFVTVQRGLGNAARAAEQSGVPAAVIDRELDGNGESIGAVSRALDQAAFRARQTGGAVLLGRLQNDTLAALRGWAAEAAGNGVAPAPVSAILLGQVE